MARANPDRATFPMVQALRAVAALAVALHHVTYDAGFLGPAGASIATTINRSMPWEAGVDIFFVISGFVMLHASAPLFGRGRTGIHIFAAHRIARIVPLYWATTILFLAVTAMDPAAIGASLGGARYVAASFAFIPCARPDGMVQPVYGLGWTLNYEMFFYLVFAACLWMPRRRALLALSAGLGGLVALGAAGAFSTVVLQFWSDPIVLEFLLGIWLRALLPQIAPLPTWLRATLIVGAIAAFQINGLNHGVPRVLAWGLPAACLVAASVTGQQRPLSSWTRLLGRIGDASYALYLLHAFVIRAGSLLYRHLGLTSTAATLTYIVASLVLALLVAVVVNSVAERPITRSARRRLEPAAVAP